jgi:hypothetical protein
MNRLKKQRCLLDDYDEPETVVPVVPVKAVVPPKEVPPIDPRTLPWLERCVPKTWGALRAFAPNVTLAMLQLRRGQVGLTQVMNSLEALPKTLTILQGNPGTGKTTMLRLLAAHKGMEVEFVHTDSDDEFMEVLKVAKERGLSSQKRLWVFEHFDCLSKPARSALLKALPLQGPAVATSWYTEENLSDLKVNWISMDPWDHASRVQFMMTFKDVDITDDECSACLKAAGDDISGAWTMAQMRIPSSSDVMLRAPPSNLRILVDRSLSLSGTRNELDMLQDCDDDVCLSLVHESLPDAICASNNLKALVVGMDALSACDAATEFSSLVKNAYIGGTLQACMPLPRVYSSGISFSAPKSSWAKNRAKDGIKEARALRGYVEDGEIDSRVDILGGWGEDNTLLHHIYPTRKKK